MSANDRGNQEARVENFLTYLITNKATLKWVVMAMSDAVWFSSFLWV